jgi:hypothetical protein
MSHYSKEQQTGFLLLKLLNVGESRSYPEELPKVQDGPLSLLFPMTDGFKMRVDASNTYSPADLGPVMKTHEFICKNGIIKRVS